MDVQYLGLDDLIVIAAAVFGIEAGVLAKMANLMVADMAVNAPAASFGGQDFYPDFATKVGVLGYRIARQHALPDGNKRTAFLATWTSSPNAMAGRGQTTRRTAPSK